ADAIGAELFAQREELLRDERLHGRAVERPLARAQRAEVQRERHERLARSRRRREHDVAALEQLEDRLLLLGIEREPLLRDEDDEGVEDRSGVRARAD